MTLYYLFFLSIMLAEIAGSLFSASHFIRAIAVSGVILCTGPFCLLKAYQSQELNKFNINHYLTGLWLTGAFATLIAGIGNNSLYYVLADIYHWHIELILVSFFTASILVLMDEYRIIQLLIYASLISGVFGCFFLFLSYSGLINTGGHMVKAIDMWRLTATRGFPEYSLIFLTATYLFQGSLSDKLYLLRTISMCILLILLIFTLKRVAWISYFLSLPIIFLSRRLLKTIIKAGCILLPVMIFIILNYPMHVIFFISNLLDFLTYNPNYTVFDTLMDRVRQFTELYPYMKNNSIGYGFGAAYDYKPGEVVHYVHNYYIYYFLQLGYLGMASLLLITAAIFKKSYNILCTTFRFKWINRLSLAVLFVMLFNGLTLLSTHTVFCGIGYGFIFASFRLVKHENTAAAYA